MIVCRRYVANGGQTKGSCHDLLLQRKEPPFDTLSDHMTATNACRPLPLDRACLGMEFATPVHRAYPSQNTSKWGVSCEKGHWKRGLQSIPSRSKPARLSWMAI